VSHYEQVLLVASGQTFTMPGETAQSPIGERLSQELDPLSDPEERRVLYAALDSFR